VRITVEDGLCLVSYRIIDPAIWPRSRDAEFTLGFLHGIITRCCGSLPPGTLTLAFEHERDSGADLAGESRSEPLHGQPTNLLAFPATLLDQPVPASLPHPLMQSGPAFAPASGRAPGPAGEHGPAPFAEGIVEAIYARLGQGPLDQATIAADCGLSRRSLRRRLSQAGLSFREVMEEARQSYAVWALRETNLPVAEIAWRLGYDDQGAFARAFRRQAGTSPSRMRRGGVDQAP
jgi:AraC-like DNA-binding protein